MKREDVHTVKIYFIKPIDLINVVINTLIGMEYETYTIDENEMEKLLRILAEDLRSIVFICVANRQDVVKSLEYIEKLKAVEKTAIQVGAFAYSAMDPAVKQKFLFNLATVTTFSDLKENTVGTLRTILQAFDARGNRKFIRVKARGTSEAFIMRKGRVDPIKGKIIDISAFAFACEIDPISHEYFQPGCLLSDILLSIKGIRIRTAAKLLGFSEKNRNIHIFRYFGTEIKDGKTVMTEKVPLETKQKLHRYISSCLKDDLKDKLAKVRLPKAAKPRPAGDAVTTEAPEEAVPLAADEEATVETAEPAEAVESCESGGETSEEPKTKTAAGEPEAGAPAEGRERHAED
jgi:hypothetical protein